MPWTVIELAVGGTVRAVYTAKDAPELEEKVSRRAEGVFGRPLTAEERVRLHKDCEVRAEGRVFAYCARWADEGPGMPADVLVAESVVSAAAAAVRVLRGCGGRALDPNLRGTVGANLAALRAALG